MNALRESRPLYAAALVVAAMVILGLTDNLVVIVAEDAGLWQFHLVRAVFGLPVILIAARIARATLRPVHAPWVVLRSLLVSLSMFFYFGALAFVSVAESAAGLFTAPIWVLLISFLVYRDRVGLFRILVVAVGFSGVLLVLQPDLSNLSLGILLPLAGGIFYALGAIVTRRYCSGESALTLLVGFFLSLVGWGVLGCIVLAIWQPVVPDGAQGFLLRGWSNVSMQWYGWIAVQSLGAVIGVGLIFRAYLLAEPSFVSVFEYAMLVTGAFWGWVLWGQGMNGVAFIGGAMIIFAGIVLARGERAPRGGGGVAP